MELVFFISIFVIFFAYLGYPVSLILVGSVSGRKVNRGSLLPDVTLIITAFNEEKRIQKKIRNTLNLDYPRDRLQIIVASDGSIDRTDEIVQAYASDDIELIKISPRGGKENAQKEAINYAHGKILVFTDAATILDREGLRQIVSNFSDTTVGCVSSVDRLITEDGQVAGEGFYVRYEMWIRKLESRINSLLGVSGSFFAVRREICDDFSGDMQSDFRTALNTVKKGLRAVSDPLAIGYYQDVADERHEFDRKVRTVLRGLTVFFRHMEFLNFLKYGFFSYQYLCHKLLRWMIPVCIFIGFTTNAVLATRSLWFLILFVTQTCFYALAVWGWRNGTSRLGIWTRIPTYFIVVNASIVVAWILFFMGRRIVMWSPSKR
jgi:glycosyltransferase involved in cell wall biosynthesis